LIERKINFTFVFVAQVGDESDPMTQQKQPHNRKKKETVRDQLVSTDLFNLYNMLHNVKLDLLWSRNTQEELPEPSEDDLPEQNYDLATATTTTPLATVPATTKATSKPEKTQDNNNSQTTSNSNTNNKETVSRTATPEIKGHVRRPSTVSVSSSNSTSSTISDSDSEISNENDSGIESENQPGDKDKTLEISRQFRSNLLGLYKSLEQMTEAASYLTARYQSDIGGSNC
jgi:hypothetical protein